MNEKYNIQSIKSKELENILSEECLDFIADLHHLFNSKRLHLLEERKKVQEKINKGWLPDFLDETQQIRDSSWTILSTPDDLLDRRVEITGPPIRKMIINALNSGVKVFMADFEDSNSPTWSNCVNGQINLKDAIDKTISFDHPTKNKTYILNDHTATLMVRPRGWHLEEKNVLYNNNPISASIFDFAILKR